MTSSVARPCDASLQLVTRSILDRVEGFPQKSYARRLAFRSLITRLMRPASPAPLSRVRQTLQRTSHIVEAVS